MDKNEYYKDDIAHIHHYPCRSHGANGEAGEPVDNYTSSSQSNQWDALQANTLVNESYGSNNDVYYNAQKKQRPVQYPSCDTDQRVVRVERQS